jgi:AraC-like DNA-binding protein
MPVLLPINHTNYKLILSDVAAKLQLPYHAGDDFLHVLPPVGEGVFKVLTLFDELQVLLADFTFTVDVTTMRPKSEEKYFLLHFDDAIITNTAVMKVDDETLYKTNTRHSVARLTSSLFSNTEHLPAHLHIKSVKVLFNEKWLKKYMGLDAETDVIKRYLALKTESFDIELLDAEYLKLLDDLWVVKKDDPLQNVFLQNRVTLLIERFFSRLYNKANLLKGKFDLSSAVIQQLIVVEQELVSDFSKLPPTIEQFSKMAAMSTTKLKKSFKIMYGDSIYAYYQKLRLQKANELLASGDYTVKQTAFAVGYASLDNFTTAYKKTYNKKPVCKV